jgi:hypothetical protein
MRPRAGFSADSSEEILHADLFTIGSSRKFFLVLVEYLSKVLVF